MKEKSIVHSKLAIYKLGRKGWEGTKSWWITEFVSFDFSHFSNSLINMLLAVGNCFHDPLFTIMSFVRFPSVSVHLSACEPRAYHAPCSKWITNVLIGSAWLPGFCTNSVVFGGESADRLPRPPTASTIKVKVAKHPTTTTSARAGERHPRHRHFLYPPSPFLPAPSSPPPIIATLCAPRGDGDRALAASIGALAPALFWTRTQHASLFAPPRWPS